MTHHMTSKEIVQIALKRARTDMLEDLRVMEFVYVYPTLSADAESVDTLVGFAFRRLVELCSRYRKRQSGESDRFVVIGDDTFCIYRVKGGHLVNMNGSDPIGLKWVPEDMDEILKEFHASLADRRAMAESIVAEYWAMRKAGDIALAAVNVQAGDYLKENGMELFILLADDGTWKCFMRCDEKEKTIAFLSGMESIFDDIRRVVDKGFGKQ